jgi:hypothetical protein
VHASFSEASREIQVVIMLPVAAKGRDEAEILVAYGVSGYSRQTGFVEKSFHEMYLRVLYIGRRAN